jgi:hypothetical protein
MAPRGAIFISTVRLSLTRSERLENHSATSSGLILDPQGLMYKLTLAGSKIARIR